MADSATDLRLKGAERIEVAPAVLSWARTTMNFDLSTAARRIGISELTLQRWETGDLWPTIRQLEKAAHVYRRPLVVLLLPEPAKDFDALRDFRKLAGPQAPAWSPELHSEFRRALSQREVLVEIQEFSPDSVHESTNVPKITRDTGIEEAGDLLRQVLRSNSWKQGVARRPGEFLRAAIAAVEELGVLVIQTVRVDVEEMRGFTLAEWPFPVIALNGTDSARARLFTLIHEFVHLSLRTGGLCDLHKESSENDASSDTELFCNRVAAAVLMPRTRLLLDAAVGRKPADYPWSIDELRDISDRYGASAEAVMLRLIALRVASWDRYQELKPRLRDRVFPDTNEADEHTQHRGQPTYYQLMVRRMGRSYIASVLDAYRSSAISSADALSALGIQHSRLPRLDRLL